MKSYKKSKKREFRGNFPKKRSKGVLWAWIIILVMVISVIGFVSVDFAPSSADYNGFKFTSMEKGWMGKINKENRFFNYHPTELENIPFDRDATTIIKKAKVLYLTSDPEDDAKDTIGKIEFELIEELDEKNFIYAFTKENPFNKTVIGCVNATALVPVMKFENSNETSVEAEDNCIIIKAASSFHFINLRDRILYGVLGVMNG